MEEAPQQISNLSASSASIHVQLINNDVEHVISALLKPLPSTLHDPALDVSKEDDVEHRVVGDEKVGCGILHVPAAAHLRTVEAREEVSEAGIVDHSV
jgi:hypothetical protein